MPTKYNNTHQIWRRKELLRKEVNKILGDYDLTENEKNIYIYIACHKSNIYRIVHEEFFSNLSFSTIKRAVLELKKNNLITAEQDTVDKRVMWLKITEE